MITNPCSLSSKTSVKLECRITNPEHEDSTFSDSVPVTLIGNTNKRRAIEAEDSIVSTCCNELIGDTIDQLVDQLNHNNITICYGSGLMTIRQNYPRPLLPHHNNKSANNQHVQKSGRETWRLRISKWSLSMPEYLKIASCFVLLLLTSCSLCTASLCDPKSWWNAARHRCSPCTVCEGEMIPLRPCQVHQDTVCGSIYDLKIDWVVLSRTEPNWKDRRKLEFGQDYEFDQQQLSAEQLQQYEEEALPLNWQTAALFLAVLACLLFFIVAACILVHHTRQWRRMERRLDQDVEELSTKLMAKLAEVQSLESGTFFIGNAEALGIPTTVISASMQQTPNVHLPEKSIVGHHHHHHHQGRRHLAGIPKSGNVYIEENGGSKC